MATMTTARRRLMLIGGALTLASVLAAASAAAAQDASPGPAQGASPAPSACLPDTEPNDTPETAPTFAAPGCFAGTLPDSDQDLLVWTITEAQAAQPWDITVDGIEETITGTKFLTIASPPGEMPLVIGNQVLEVAQAPGALGPTITSGVLLPAGRYLVGTSRSTTTTDQPPLDIGYQVTIAAGAPCPRPQRSSPMTTPRQQRTSKAPLPSVVTCAIRRTTTAGRPRSCPKDRRGTCGSRAH